MKKKRIFLLSAILICSILAGCGAGTETVRQEEIQMLSQEETGSEREEAGVEQEGTEPEREEAGPEQKEIRADREESGMHQRDEAEKTAGTDQGAQNDINVINETDMITEENNANAEGIPDSYYDAANRSLEETIEKCNLVYIMRCWDVISFEISDEKLRIQAEEGSIWDYYPDSAEAVPDIMEYPLASDCHWENFNTDLLYCEDCSYEEVKEWIEEQRRWHIDFGESDSPVMLGIALADETIVRIFTISS